MTNLYFWRRDFNASLASPLYVCNTPINWPLTELTPWILTRDSTHMAPGPVLLWSRSQSKLELGTNPFLCPALWAASCVTRIILLPPSTDTFPREISTRANSHFLPSQIRPTHTHMSILGFLNFVIDTVMNTQYAIIRISVCQTHVHSTK